MLKKCPMPLQECLKERLASANYADVLCNCASTEPQIKSRRKHSSNTPSHMPHRPAPTSEQATSASSAYVACPIASSSKGRDFGFYMYCHRCRKWGGRYDHEVVLRNFSLPELVIDLRESYHLHLRDSCKGGIVCNAEADKIVTETQIIAFESKKCPIPI